MPTSSNAHPPVRITSYPDFCRVIPLMLGFRPHDSLVLVVISDRTMAMAARFDLPHTGEVAIEVARQCADLADRHDADEVVLIGYTDTPGDLWGLLDQVDTGLGEVPVHLLVTDHRHYWQGPDDPGTALPENDVPGAGALAGRPILDSRDELADTVAGPNRVTDEICSVMASTEQFNAHLTVPEQMSLLHELIREYLGTPVEVSLQSRLLAAALVDDPFVREHARLSINRRNAAGHVPLWQQVVDVTPDEIATGPLCLLAMAAWMSGHGALMQVCLERAEWLSPDDEMVTYLTMLARSAADPRTWEGWPDVHESWRDDAVS
ncbi:DUF4192 domain-containing protein [Enemella sp. A6]|uniref:DUF4192 domain-containing protein n=1 Tax=Enemella sp. A6 TaxID=3440152 RepID=UPI003EB74958